MHTDKEQYVIPTYGRFPITLVKGEGAYVYDDNGKKYLDFVAGVAVNSLGHGHKKLAKAVCDQANNLMHVSNYYWNEPMMNLAEKLVKNSTFAQVFFCNSGAEAIEAALKLARKYAYRAGSEKFEIITMKHSFHGRTLGAITATGQSKYQEGFAPLLPGVKYAELNNFDSVKAQATEKTCAILIEPIQGESGIHPCEAEFLKQVRQFATENGVLLIFDEVQCGVGRSGKLFAHEHFGVCPDIAVLAKGLAGGVPIGAILATEQAATGFKAGDHGSTFGGNPLASAAGNVVIDELLGGVLENAHKQGAYLSQKLKTLAAKHKDIVEVRGIGLMQGAELNCPVKDIIAKCVDMGLLLINAGENVIRFVPPLIISKEQIDECIEVLDSVLGG